jgi:hypothetical protein
MDLVVLPSAELNAPQGMHVYMHLIISAALPDSTLQELCQ